LQYSSPPSRLAATHSRLKELPSLLELAGVLTLACFFSLPGNASESAGDLEASHTEAEKEPFGDLEVPLGTVGPDGRWSFLTDNLRWAVDLAGRVNTTENSGYTNQEFFGIDLHKVVSTKKRDLGTLLIQFYGKYDSSPNKTKWAYQTRLAYFNYHVTKRRGVNVKLGHFFIPYGLNIPSRTPGTLRQFDTGPNLGHKIDWGTSLNGVASHFEYEIALTRGSGFEYESQDSPYIASGRVGTPNHLPLAMGVSGFYGKVLKNGKTTERSRLGVDWRWTGGVIDVLGEISIGRDSHTKDIVNGFIDLSWRSPAETLLLYTQGNIMMKRDSSAPSNVPWDKVSYLTVGSQLALATHYWISADYRHELTSTNKPDRIRIQLRYRFF